MMLGFIKVLTAYFPEDTIKETKKQTTEWEKIFSIYVPNKGRIARIYKLFLQCSNSRTESWIKKWKKKRLGYFTKEDTWMVNRHMKRCSTSLFIKSNKTIGFNWKSNIPIIIQAYRLLMLWISSQT